MFKYAIKIFFRRLIKRDKQIWLNLLGLSIGFAVVIFLSFFIYTELRRGKTIEGCEKIFRVSSEKGSNAWSERIIKNFDKVSDVKASTMIFEFIADNNYIKRDGDIFSAGQIILADNQFFNVFKNNVVVGNISNALSEKERIVITEKEAKRFFGRVDVIGEKLTLKSKYLSGEFDFYVAAVIENLSSDALLNFDIVIPKKAIKRFYPFYSSENWEPLWNVFISLITEESKEKVICQINDIFQSSAPDWVLEDNGKIKLDAYKTLYLGDKEVRSRIKMMGTVLIVVYLLTIINFINLFTARKEKKLKEISVNNIMGANRWGVFSIIFEDVFPIIIIAIVIANVYIILSLSVLNGLFSSEFTIYDFFEENILFIEILVVIITVIIFIALIRLSFYKKNTWENEMKFLRIKKAKSRNFLLLSQFTLSIFLIISLFVIDKQVGFMRDKSMGFNKENIICIPLAKEMIGKGETMSKELNLIPEIRDITMSSRLFGNSWMSWGMSLNSDGEEKRVSYSIYEVDKNFFDFFGLKIIEGEGFRPSSIRDCEHVFNETAVKFFGIEDINHANISSYNHETGAIIGVVQDFNFHSFHHQISPLAFVCLDPSELSIFYLNLQIKDSQHFQNTMGKIEKVWKNYVDELPFEWFFLDESLDKLYEQDIKSSRIFFLVTVLSFVIGCIGLLGTVIFISEQRTKEIGIRKVNGAKIYEVMNLLNRDFVKWVVVAFIIAMPVAYYAMSRWLENFAYRTKLSWWIFAVAGIVTLIIALLTVSWQSYKAATRNPVQALRYE